MSQSTVAKRYAEALFQLAQEKQVVSEVKSELEEIAKVIESNPEIISLLTNPKFSRDRKKQIISEVFANTSEIVMNTLLLLIDKKRVNELLNIALEYSNLAADAEGYSEATVYSTRKLTEEETEEISSTFSKLVGKQRLIISNVIEPSLLGGVRVQIGNFIFDNTISNKLESLKRTLVG